MLPLVSIGSSAWCADCGELVTGKHACEYVAEAPKSRLENVVFRTLRDAAIRLRARAR